MEHVIYFALINIHYLCIISVKSGSNEGFIKELSYHMYMTAFKIIPISYTLVVCLHDYLMFIYN